MTKKNPLYLKYIKINHFGAFSHKRIGPFSPGFNIVYGPNEAGKSTIAAFIGGVLYGWEASRGDKNSYKPIDSNRSGSLIYEEGKERFEFARQKNTDGLKDISARTYARARNIPEEQALLVSGIDKETFQTLFSLSSEELTSLSKTSDIASKLFTAGSGTQVSPVEVLRTLKARVSDMTSKKASAHDSLTNLAQEIHDCSAQMKELRLYADGLKQDEIRLHDYQLKIKELSSLRDQLHKIIGKLGRAESVYTEIEKQDGQLQQAFFNLDVEIHTIDQKANMLSKGLPELSYGMLDEIRQTLLDYDQRIRFYEEQARVAEVSYDTARAQVASAPSGGQAGESQKTAQDSRSKSQLWWIVAGIGSLLSVVIALVALICSLSYLFVASSLLMLGVILSLFVAFKAPSGTHSVQAEGSHSDVAAQVRQAEELVNLSYQRRDDERATIAAYLSAHTLLAGVSTISQALRVVDESEQTLHSLDELLQKGKDCHNQQFDIMRRREQLDKQRIELLSDVGLALDGNNEDMASLRHEHEQKCSDIQKRLDELFARLGEIKQRLRDGVCSQDLDVLKIKREQLLTHYNESLEHMAVLLLAQKILEEAIVEWEGTKQPKVYREASRLMSLMTDGRWTEIRVNEDGQLRIVDAVFNEQPPHHLSLGTCQQMYLSLRIALLICAKDIGTSLPVLADDILVHFDGSRRIGAMKALCELARHRQVIFFTCHREVVDLIMEQNPESTLIAL